MKILIIGYGVSGKGASVFLQKMGHEVVVLDRLYSEALLDSPDFPLDGFDQVVISPGVGLKHPLVQKAISSGIEVIGEIELGFRHLQNKAFGVTGTNGKTTTVLLTEHILKNVNLKAKAVGNVGKSLTDYLLNPDLDEILIVELSSFQLETVQSRKLDVGIVLNLFPNHLDWHSSYEEYVKAKAKLANAIKEEGELYVSRQVKKDFGTLLNGEVFEKDLALINELSYTQWMMPSKQSIEAAYLLCKRCGVTDIEFLKHLETFRKPAHRIEWVAEINGVSYYDDSKSSNVQSVVHAVEKLNGSLVLIVGGVHKGSSYKPWIEAFHQKVRLIIAYGRAAPIIEYELRPYFQLHVVSRFDDAVQLAKLEAKKNEIVLLSPGCSSYDQFESYQHRGEAFKRLVRKNHES